MDFGLCEKIGIQSYFPVKQSNRKIKSKGIVFGKQYLLEHGSFQGNCIVTGLRLWWVVRRHVVSSHI